MKKRRCMTCGRWFAAPAGQHHCPGCHACLSGPQPFISLDQLIESAAQLELDVSFVLDHLLDVPFTITAEVH